MVRTNSERPYSCFQPQSRRAAVSSNAIGQPSAADAGDRHTFCKTPGSSSGGEAEASLRPANLTYGLPDRVHVVGDLKVGQAFLYLPDEVARREARGVDVVGAAEQRRRRSLQELQSGPETVVWTEGRERRSGSTSR